MSQNKIKPIINPFTSDLQMISDLELGWTVRNQAKAPFFVLDGFTRVYPNLTIPIGMTIDVQDGGELIVL